MIALIIIRTIGVFQVVANAALLIRGRSRLPAELVSATPRIAELTLTSWLYGAIAHLVFGVMLLVLSSGAVGGDRTARGVVALIAAEYAAFGIAAFVRARRPGMLAFPVMGAALGAVLYFTA